MSGQEDVPITIPKLKVFVTGGTGYIGGAVLSELLRNPDLQVRTLVRSQAHIDAINDPSHPGAATGSIPESILGDLSDHEKLKKLASESDIVVNTADSGDLKVIEALLEGLAESGESSKKIFIHTSGTSTFAVFADGSKAGKPINDEEDLFALQNKLQEEGEQGEGNYAFRKANLKITALGKEKGVKTYIIIPPLIYGTTPGFIPRLTIQIPALLRAAIKTSASHYVGDGTAVWSNVHVADLAALYLIILRCALSGVAKEGEEGYYFASNGEKSWKELAEGIKTALDESNDFKRDVKLESWDIPEASKELFGEFFAKLGFSSNVITVADKARSLGWKPKFGGDSVLESIKKDLADILEQGKPKEE